MAPEGNKVYTVVTVGSFDGVHTGHRALLDVLRKRAEVMNGTVKAVTFDPHPRVVLGTAAGLKLLTTTPEKRILLGRMGIENLEVVPFTKEFSLMSKERFLDEFLLGRMQADEVVLGFNHRFGNGNSGDGNFLLSSGKIRVTEVGQHRCNDEKVSSTVIRNLIEGGEMLRANELLGHRYLIIGEADGEGRVEVDAMKLLPPPGRYGALIDGREYVTEVMSGNRLAIPDVRASKVTIEICSDIL